jgi:Ca2+-binding EF-hand superfamily protein
MVLSLSFSKIASHLPLEAVMPRATVRKPSLSPDILVTLGDVFLSFDTDGNGELDIDEFREFFEKTGITNESPDLAFAIFDADHSGMLSYHEFVEFFSYRGLAETAPRTYFRRAFQAFDLDRNACLDADEMTRFFEIPGVENPRSLALALVDAAGGKGISFEQFANFLELPPA